MSYELESKKRKFHRILDSISKPQQPEPTPTPPPAPPMTARERVAANVSIKKVRLSSNDRSELTSVRNSIQKISRPANRTSSASSASSNKRPTFVPWDRERFLERLETFRRVDRWTSKPAPINEVQWAKHGWICTDSKRVTCVSECGGAVVIKLPDEIDELDGFDSEKVRERNEVRATLVDQYAKMLVESHGESCPWRQKSCDATIQHLPLTNCDVALSGLHDRYMNILKMGDKLPANDVVQTLQEPNLDDIAKLLPDDWFKEAAQPAEPAAAPTTEGQAPRSENQESSESNPSSADAPRSVNRVALALALFGWDTASDGAAGLVGCGACFRRLGLWMYKPKDNGEVTVYTSLDVASEHMEYCPWINKVAQSGTGRPNEKVERLRAGWELVVEAVKVKNRRRMRFTKSSETLWPATPVEEHPLEDEDPEAKKKADSEWWTKIQRVRQILKSRTPKPKPASS
ncbi:hypothetical protein N7499_011800 [Penicillium canescens]|uniref:Uncharacterized protein n=1 Tax=Penicillium canescens TaxID=5083 RepID=A0AAD6IKQ5_PENCN|nr:uncharacterized protein N7446_007062 [Penicillium canescens]KAJ6049613.1 hypothetical protein N7444_006329 [Penicillium canescens]KAJ6052419.1 hypothetical protein N7460_002953 [Penicillium canescens]KAJ6062942.1 hypothetical protein N7446_007062 [Penicillium canescens]KAJ6069913.1 hypothetical protein N7499_011800 [Penicillium canescens]KAJ6182036.1 hypothetical protein N7485_000678 [Penicillium canescens]